MPNTIKLKKYTDIIIEQDSTAVAVWPGMLLELTTTANQVQAHSTAGGNALPYVALENELEGEDIDTAYAAAGDKVQVWVATRGEEAYMILADGENVSIGDYLESAGNGYLQKHVTDTESFESNEEGAISVYPQQIVAQALEAVDLSGSSGEESSGTLGYNKRIKVRIV
jgi:hypothetical protein